MRIITISSSPSPSPLFKPNPTPLRNFHTFTSPIRRDFPSTRTRVVASLDVSWSPPPAHDDYGGWAFVEESPVIPKKKGLNKFMWVGVGTSVAVLLAAISLSKKGLRCQWSNSLHALQGVSMLFRIGSRHDKTAVTGALKVDVTVAEASPKDEVCAIKETMESEKVEKLERVVTPVAVDSVQEEAVSVLKKLKIIESDVKANELCTRREYARWLVKANCSLERNPKYRIVPSMLLSGSVVASFDDIISEDPDFEYIQALAEAGIFPSKLSRRKSGSDLDSLEDQCVYFFPDRFICRQDLVNWKVQLDYELMPEIEKISLKKVGFMDMREISQDASPALFMDFLAGDKSTLRKVFGQTKRLQPKKFCTKAQAAVALTTGRMDEEIRAELLRLEAENSARVVEIKEIRSDLLEKGDIQRFWDEKLKEVITYRFDVQKAYLAVIDELEQEKIVQEKSIAEHLKEKAAMDCQRQLLSSLKEEISEMSATLEDEKMNNIADQHNVQKMLSDIQNKREGLLDAKSILEAEKEALRILRTWVEDEARKSQARAKVLEEVGRRWNWDDRD